MLEHRPAQEKSLPKNRSCQNDVSNLRKKETPFIPGGSSCFPLTATTRGETAQEQDSNATKALGAELAHPKADPR